MKAALRVLLVGAAGRMGKTIVDLARRNPNIQIVAKCDLGDAIEPAMKDCDVVIDFSHADAIDGICRTVLQHRRALVIGTTGHSGEQQEIIQRAAKVLPIVFASNFSVGVNVLFWLRRSKCALLVDAKSRRVARPRFRSRDCRNAPQDEKGCAKWDGQDSGGNCKAHAELGVSNSYSIDPGRRSCRQSHYNLHWARGATGANASGK